MQYLNVLQKVAERFKLAFKPKIIATMKLVGVLIFAVCMQASATTLAQKITVKGKQMSLKQVFKDIHKQARYNFIYSNKDISRANPVTMNIVGTVDEVLQHAFANQPLIYTIEDKMIIVKRKPSGLTNVREDVVLPDKEISGTVRDLITGDPLAGVTVRLKGTQKGTTTNEDGQYRLVLDRGTGVLVFSFLGYQKVEKPIRNRMVLNVVLKKAVIKNEEVVVTGYYSLPKERATGSFSHLDRHQLDEINSFGLKDKLEGLVPGLSFLPNSNADQDPSLDRSSGMVLRGYTTFGDNSPLIVIDGFPVMPDVDPWSTINPDDVESVTVLKDAAAASIWGAQAANGVIAITTRSGIDPQRSALNVSLEYQVKPKPDLYKIPFASGESAIDVYKYLFFETGYFNLLSSASFRNRYDFPDVISTILQMKLNEISEEEGNNRLDELSKIDVRDEFGRLFLRKETGKKATITFNFGNAKNNMRASVMAFNSDKFNRGDESNQFMGDLSSRFSPAKWFSVLAGVNLSVRHNKENGVDIRDLQYIPQMSRILDDNGDYLPMIKQGPKTFYYGIKTDFRRDLVEQYDLPYDWDWNLKREIDNRDIKRNRSNLRTRLVLTFRPVRWIDLDISYSYQNNKTLYSNYMNPESWYVRNTVLQYYRSATNSFPVPAGGMLYEERSDFASHDGRFQVTVNKKFGENHELRVLGGIEVRKDLTESIPYGFYGYDPQSLTQITSLDYKGSVTPFLTGQPGRPVYPIPTLRSTSIYLRGRDDRFLSYYGNFGYSYKNKYDLTGSIRLDKTNLYGRTKSYRELPQWSLGGGYTISKESFFSIDKINFFRLRLAYGWNGHIDKSASPYITGTPWIDPINLAPYAVIQEAPNPSLTWEKTANINFGIDFGLFNNRIRGSFEMYRKKSTNVLSNFEVNPTYGFYYDEAVLNNGDILNKGIEIQVSATVLNVDKFSWRSVINYSHNKNKVLNVETPASNIASWANLSQFNPVKGQPVDYIAVAELIGYDDDGLMQFKYQGKDQSILDIPYIGADMEGLFKFVGQRSPKHYGSFMNTFGYGNLELSVGLLYYFGYYTFKDYPPRNFMHQIQTFSSFFTFLPELIEKRWRSPEDNETAGMYGIKTKVTNYTTTIANDILAQYNNRSLINAGHVRVQSIRLTYRLPQKWIGNAFKGARIQLQARNLGPVYRVNKDHVDPMFPQYSGSLYSAFYNTVRCRPEYSVAIKLDL